MMTIEAAACVVRRLTLFAGLRKTGAAFEAL
jgi:hypothetical protein